MKRVTTRSRPEAMRDYYDFSGGVRGKYAKRYAEGTNVVVLAPDVAKVFPDTDSVNQTLRAVARIIDLQARRGRPSGSMTRPTRRRSGPGASPG